MENPAADEKSLGGDLDALVSWLRTLPQFEGKFKESSDTVELLEDKIALCAILSLAEDLFTKAAPAVDESNDKVWGAIAELVAMEMPPVARRIAGKPISTLEVRVTLLAALLCRAVSEDSPDRRNYITCIMGLPSTTQQVLMSIIERGRQDVGTTPSPQQASKEAVGSAHRTPATTTPAATMTSHNFTSPPQPIRLMGESPSRVWSEMDQEGQMDLLALVDWLRTFPSFEGVNLENIHQLEDPNVSSKILQVAEQICDDEANSEQLNLGDATDPWVSIQRIIFNVAPLVVEKFNTAGMMTSERHCRILATLLCYSVSSSCTKRKACIGQILSLPNETQRRLMQLIEATKIRTPQGKMSSDSTPLPETPASDESRRRRRTSSTGYTPRRKRQSLGRDSVEGFLSPSTFDSSLEKMVKELRKQNENLKSELEESQARETEVGQKMQDLEAKSRRETMRLESEALRREEETREEYESKLTHLQHEVEDLREARDKEERARQELASVRDEIDLLEHTKEKLVETEEKLRKCRERIEQLGDVKDALKREEEAHGASVEECLRLDNELKTLQPLRRQLEDYKKRAVDAEFKVAECQEELKRMEHMTQSMNSAQKELLMGSRLHQDEAEELRRRLADAEGAPLESDGPALGEGISELNPAVKEEMLRLRNENIRLKAFAEKREDDSVQKLEENLEDASRLSEKFKEQFIVTKGDLARTRQELEESKNREADLQVRVEELATACDEAEHLSKEYKNELDKTKSELDRTTQQLQESRERERVLQSEVEEWTQKQSETEAMSLERQLALEKITDELEATSAAFLESKAHAEKLTEEVKHWTGKANEAETLASQYRDQWASIQQALSETEGNLSASKQREAILNENLTALTEKVDSLEARLEEELRTHESEMNAAHEKFESTRLQLEEEYVRQRTELETALTNNLETERAQYREQLDQASKNYADLEDRMNGELSSLKQLSEDALGKTAQEHENLLADLHRKHQKEMDDLAQATSEEREQLMTKGKVMLKQTKEKSKAEISRLEGELLDTKQGLDELRKEYECYQQRSREKVSSYKQKLNFAASRVNELGQEVDSKDDTIQTVEREKFKLQEENERFRRQLGGRFGADGKVQNQLEMLQKEFNAVLDENRELKKDVSKMSNPLTASTMSLSSIPESSSSDGTRTSYTRGGVSGSTLSQLRKEYEETIEALNDEKRELVMKNSAAITDVQKAEQRAWELEKKVGEMKEELTSVKLALQRAELMSSEQDDSLVVDQSYHTCEEDGKENSQSTPPTQSTPSSVLLDLDAAKEQDGPPATAMSFLTSILSPSLKANAPDSSAIRASDIKPKVKPQENPSIEPHHPTLMDYTSAGSYAGPDAQPECKQS